MCYPLRSAFAAQHVYGDITEILTQHLRQEWAGDLEFKRSVIQKTLETLKLSGQDASAISLVRQDLVSRAGQDFLDGALVQLTEQVSNLREQPLQQWCLKHEDFCSCMPDMQPSALHCEISGTTCVAFSSMGALWGWLDVATVAFLAWIAKCGAHLYVHQAPACQYTKQ